VCVGGGGGVGRGGGVGGGGGGGGGRRPRRKKRRNATCIPGLGDSVASLATWPGQSEAHRRTEEQSSGYLVQE